VKQRSLERSLRLLLLPLALLPGGLRAQGTGVYGELPLKEREVHLVESAAGLAEQFGRRGYLHPDPALGELVRRIGRRLAPPPSDPYIEYRFHVLRDPLPNAFALPDGQVFVNTGMLASLENEAQLATLLAHEIAHAAGHHTIQLLRASRSSLVAGSIARSYGASVALSVGGLELELDLGSGPGPEPVFATAVMGYDRSLEEEADRHAVASVAEAGYDVRESPRLFEVLALGSAGEPSAAATEWGSPPQLRDRARTLREVVARLGETTDLEALTVGREAYRPLRHAVGLLTAEDLIRAERPRAAALLAWWLVADDDRDARAHYALAEALRALGPEEATREESLAGAREEYERALQLDPGLALARRGLGLVLFEQGESRGAGRELLSYLRSRPDADDKAPILERIEAITADLRTAEGEDRNDHAKNQ